MSGPQQDSGTGTAAGEPGRGSARPPSLDPQEPAVGKADDALVGDAVSLMDGIVDYLRAIFRLESYRIEVRARGLIRKALVLVLGVVVALAGLVFVSVGVSSLLSEWLQAPYAGPLIVGGAFLIAGLIAILSAARGKES